MRSFEQTSKGKEANKKTGDKKKEDKKGETKSNEDNFSFLQNSENIKEQQDEIELNRAKLSN